MLQRAHHAVVQAALQDEADVARAAEKLVQRVFLDEGDRRRPAALHLVDLLHVGRRRQHVAARDRGAAVRARLAA